MKNSFISAKKTEVALREFLRRYKIIADNYVNSAAKDIAEQARDLLREVMPDISNDTVRVVEGNKQGEVLIKAEFTGAKALEYGTSKQAPQRFLGRALKEKFNISK